MIGSDIHTILYNLHLELFANSGVRRRGSIHFGSANCFSAEKLYGGKLVIIGRFMASAKHHATILMYLAGGMLGGSVMLALGFERVRDAARSRNLPKWMMDLGDHENVLKADEKMATAVADGLRKASMAGSGQHKQDARYAQSDQNESMRSLRSLVDEGWR